MSTASGPVRSTSNNERPVARHRRDDAAAVPPRGGDRSVGAHLGDDRQPQRAAHRPAQRLPAERIRRTAGGDQAGRARRPRPRGRSRRGCRDPARRPRRRPARPGWRTADRPSAAGRSASATMPLGGLDRADRVHHGRRHRDRPRRRRARARPRARGHRRVHARPACHGRELERDRRPRSRRRPGARRRAA